MGSKGPYEGLTCIELSTTIAGPAAGAMLADWGCEVIKVEPPSGDSFRYTMANAVGREMPNDYLNSPAFYAINRGKQSCVLDFKQAPQLEAFKQLLSNADIFITNMRQSALVQYGLDTEHVHAAFPKLVVCAMTGFGLVGPEKDAPGYDIGVFYGKAGGAMAFTAMHPKYGDRAQPSDPPPLPPQIPGGYGDFCTALAAVAGIGAALQARTATGGRGQIVQTSLLQAGIWANSFDIVMAQALGRSLGARGQRARINPLLNCYRTADGKVIWLLGLESQRHFPGLAKALQREEWLSNPTFKSAAARAKNCVAMIAEISAEVAKYPYGEVKARFDKYDVWFQLSNNADEVIADEQVRAVEGIVPIPLSAADISQGVDEINSVRTPLDFSIGKAGPKGPVPSLGEHTAEVLRAHGVKESTVLAALASNNKVKAKL